MNTTNFKLIVEMMIKDHIEKIQSGEVRLGVMNQHDEYVCESALEVLATDEEKVTYVAYEFTEETIQKCQVMTIAHRLSTFKPEPLDSAWTQ